MYIDSRAIVLLVRRRKDVEKFFLLCGWLRSSFISLFPTIPHPCTWKPFNSSAKIRKSNNLLESFLETQNKEEEFPTSSSTSISYVEWEDCSYYTPIHQLRTKHISGLTMDWGISHRLSPERLQSFISLLLNRDPDCKHLLLPLDIKNINSDENMTIHCCQSQTSQFHRDETKADELKVIQESKQRSSLIKKHEGDLFHFTVSSDLPIPTSVINSAKKRSISFFGDDDDESLEYPLCSSSYSDGGTSRTQSRTINSSTISVDSLQLSFLSTSTSVPSPPLKRRSQTSFLCENRSRSVPVIPQKTQHSPCSLLSTPRNTRGRSASFHEQMALNPSEEIPIVYQNQVNSSLSETDFTPIYPSLRLPSPSPFCGHDHPYQLKGAGIVKNCLK